VLLFIEAKKTTDFAHFDDDPGGWW